MRKIIFTFLIVITLFSCSSGGNTNLGNINEMIFKGIKTNDIELIKPYCFNNDNLYLFQNALNLSEADVNRLRQQRKPMFASYELITKIREEDNHGKINWDDTEYIDIDKYNNKSKIKPQRTQQAEVYPTTIAFKENDKKWGISISYIETPQGFYVFQIDDKHFELKE